MANYCYSFEEVIASYVSPTGFADLTNGAQEGGITISMTEDKVNRQIGADGSGMYSLRADNSGEITVKLLKNSPTNALLSAYYDAQKADPALVGQGIININSNVGDEIIATGVAFKKLPSVVYDKDGAMLEWDFYAIKIEMLLAASIV